MTNVTMAVTRVDVLFVGVLVSVMLTIARNVQFRKRTEMVVQRYDEFHRDRKSKFATDKKSRFTTISSQFFDI